MAKQAIFYEEARRLFVHEGLTLEIIFERLGGKVARRTLSKWKLDGKWDDKRKEMAKVNEDLQESLVAVAKLAIDRAKADPSPQNLFAMSKAVAALKSYQGVKIIEDETSPKERKILTAIDLEEIEKKAKLL